MLSNRYKNEEKSLLTLNQLQLQMKRQIERRIAEGLYQFEAVPCAICSGKHFEPLAEKDRYGLRVSTVICRDCGLIQTNPRMTQKSYARFYSEEYRSLYCGVDECTEDFFTEQQIRGKRIFEFIKKQKPQLNSENTFVLEIGCGAGGILQYFKEQGCETKGLDLGEGYLKFGRERYGLDLSFGTIDNLSTDRKPDVIIYSHVFEHILDVQKELEHIRAALSEDGILYIEVPSAKNLLGPYHGDFLAFLQNAHVYNFTLTSLTNLLTENSFLLIDGNEACCALFRKNPSSQKVLVRKNDYEKTMKYLNKMERLAQFRITTLLKLIIPAVRKTAMVCRLSDALNTFYSKAITRT